MWMVVERTAHLFRPPNRGGPANDEEGLYLTLPASRAHSLALRSSSAASGERSWLQLSGERRRTWLPRQRRGRGTARRRRGRCGVLGGLPSAAAPRRRTFSVSAAAGFDNQNREYVIVGGGNAAGYAARTFVEHAMADGRLCIVSKEAVPPYERPALTKGYLFPPEKKPARLPGFHTCVGSGGQRQTAEWYKENGIEVLYEDPVEAFDGKTQTLETSSGKILNAPVILGMPILDTEDHWSFLFLFNEIY